MAELMSDKSKDISKAYEKQIKKAPQKLIEKAIKEQLGSNYAVEMLLDAEEAFPFEYLSMWDVGGRKYRVVARLNKGNKILVQAKFVPNA